MTHSPQDPKTAREPYGFIQWKGTNVCIDLHCICGFHGHLDIDFLYYYECNECHRKYKVGDIVSLIELQDPEEIARIWF